MSATKPVIWDWHVLGLLNKWANRWQGSSCCQHPTLTMGLTDFVCNVHADVLCSQCGLAEGDPGLPTTGASPVQEYLQASSGSHELGSIPIRLAVPGFGPPVAQRHALDSWLGWEGNAHQSSGLRLGCPVNTLICCPSRLRPKGKSLDFPCRATSGTQFLSLSFSFHICLMELGYVSPPIIPVMNNTQPLYCTNLHQYKNLL